MAADIEQLADWGGGLKKDRSSAESTWEDIAAYCLPERRGFRNIQITEGMKRTERMFCQIGADLVSGLATNLGGLCFPHETQWFSLEVPNYERGDLPEEWQTWLEKATDAVWDDFYNPASGGAAALESALTDMVAFGATPLLVMENKAGDPDFKVRSLNLRDSYVDVDADNVANALFCYESLTAFQVAARYGRKGLPRNIVEALEADSAEARKKKFEIVSAFYKRDVYDPRRRDGLNKPWAYCVFETAERGLIQESGFNAQRFVFARYKSIVGERYGWSPAQLGLPDIKSFNQLMKAVIESGALQSKWPLAMPMDSAVRQSDIRPGGFLYYDIEAAKALGGRVPVQPMQIGGDISHSVAVLELIQKGLESIFLKPLFSLPIEGPQMTATEIIARKQQFVQQIGPVYSNVEAYLSQPLIDSCASIKLARMAERGQLPPPDGLVQHFQAQREGGARQPLRIQFSSPVQRAIDDARAQLLATTLAACQPAIGLQVDTVDNVDLDKAVRDTFGWKGCPADWLNKEDQVGQTRQARAQQMAAQQAGQEALDAAKVAPGMEKAAPGIVPQILQQAGLGVPTPPAPLGGIPA